MKFQALLDVAGGEPVFESGLLLAGRVDPADVHKQLSRWNKSGSILQLRRGLYTLAPPYRKIIPHPFLIANRMVAGSYVSLETALSFHGLIPESTALVSSVTTGRPGMLRNDYGRFQYRHVKPAFFLGYRSIPLPDRQQAYVALPEKALLDLVHLRKGGDEREFLLHLRLQNLNLLNGDLLRRFSEGQPKLQRAVQRIRELIRWEQGEYEEL